LLEIPQTAFIDSEGIGFHDNNFQRKKAKQAPGVTFTAKKQFSATRESIKG